LWNDGEDMEYTYHASTYKDTATICEVSPIIIQDLNSTKMLWNETVVRSFVEALDHHMKTFNQSVERTYFLTPTVLIANEIYPEKATVKDAKKCQPQLRMPKKCQPP
jgi:hypothetical protein